MNSVVHCIGWNVGAFFRFWISAPVVGGGFAVEQKHHDQDECADDGDKADEVPPAAQASVVEAADGDADGWDDRENHVEPVNTEDDAGSLIGFRDDSRTKDERAGDEKINGSPAEELKDQNSLRRDRPLNSPVRCQARRNQDMVELLCSTAIV